ALVGLGAIPTLDRRALRVGDRIERRIGQLIDEADYVIFVVSNASRESPWSRKELAESLRQRKRILPVVLQPHAIPLKLQGVYYADFTKDPHRGLAQLATVIQPDRK